MTGRLGRNVPGAALLRETGLTKGLQISITISDQVLTAAVAGELDLSSAGRVRDAVEPFFCHDITGLVLDLTQLDYVDSTGLRDLVVLRRDAEKAHVPMTMQVQAGSTVARVIKWMGFHTMVNVVNVPAPAITPAPATTSDTLPSAPPPAH